MALRLVSLFVFAYLGMGFPSSKSVEIVPTSLQFSTKKSDQKLPTSKGISTARAKNESFFSAFDQEKSRSQVVNVTLPDANPIVDARETLLNEKITWCCHQGERLLNEMKKIQENHSEHTSNTFLQIYFHSARRFFEMAKEYAIELKWLKQCKLLAATDETKKD